jgi:hypothetical protein
MTTWKFQKCPSWFRICFGTYICIINSTYVVLNYTWNGIELELLYSSLHLNIYIWPGFGMTQHTYMCIYVYRDPHMWPVMGGGSSYAASCHISKGEQVLKWEIWFNQIGWQLQKCTSDRAKTFQDWGDVWEFISSLDLRSGFLSTCLQQNCEKTWKMYLWMDQG